MGKGASVFNKVKGFPQHTAPHQNEQEPGQEGPALHVLSAFALPYPQLHLLDAFLELLVESNQERNLLNEGVELATGLPVSNID